MQSPYPPDFTVLPHNRIVHKPFYNASFYHKNNRSEFDALLKKYGRRIETGAIGPVEVRASSVHGYGLFAAAELKEGDWIGEYTGEQRWAMPFSRKTDYAWAVPAPTLPRLEIDARRCGNALRFANHSFDPNAVADHLLYKGNWIIVFYAARPIRANEEIFIDYGEAYWSTPQRELHISPELFDILKKTPAALTPTEECEKL